MLHFLEWHAEEEEQVTFEAFEDASKRDRENDIFRLSTSAYLVETSLG